MQLKDKTIIITGGTRGLGKAMAESFVKEGANVIVCARSEEDLKDLPESINGIKADVTKEEEMKNLAEATIEEFGQIDIWINNAGIWLPHTPIEKTDWGRAHDLMEVNFFGTVYGSKVALIQMRKQGYGLIMNILSTSALEGRATSSAYCASKYASDGFTKSLNKEVEGTNIKVIAIYPGGMKTALFNEGKPENYQEYMDPIYVTNKIVENIKKENPEEELIIQNIIK
jgi:short-subunit dehydrogenase